MVHRSLAGWLENIGINEDFTMLQIVCLLRKARTLRYVLNTSGHGISTTRPRKSKITNNSNNCVNNKMLEHDWLLRVNVSKNQRNRGHSSKFNFAHTLSIGRPKSHTHDKDVRLLKFSLVWEKST